MMPPRCTQKDKGMCASHAEQTRPSKSGRHYMDNAPPSGFYGASQEGTGQNPSSPLLLAEKIGPTEHPESQKGRAKPPTLAVALLFSI